MQLFMQLELQQTALQRGLAEGDLKQIGALAEIGRDIRYDAGLAGQATLELVQAAAIGRRAAKIVPANARRLAQALARFPTV